MKQDYDDIKEFLDGSMPAFHRIYSRYERQMFFYINSMVRQRETAEDIFQEVDETIGGEEKMTYLDILSDQAPDIVDQLSTREMIDKIQKAAEKLPEKQKEVFLLRCDADLKFKEIAEMTGASLNTILGRMHYAIKKIRNELIDEY